MNAWKSVSFTPGGKRSKVERVQHAKRLLEIHAPTIAPKPSRQALPPMPAALDRWGEGLSTRSYWNPAALAQQPVKAASGDVAGIYPFLADAGIGSSGPMLGLDLGADALFHFSPWDALRDGLALSTNVLILGAFHSGKSATAKMLAMRSLAFGHQVVVPSDSKGEWVAIADFVGGDTYRMGEFGTRINPLDAGPRHKGADLEQHELMVRDRRRALLISIAEVVAGHHLTAIEHAVLAWALERARASTGDRPTIRRVWEQLVNPTAEDKADRPDLLAAAATPRFVLERFVAGDLQGLFEDESSITFNAEAPMVVVDTSALFERSELAAMVTQMCTSSWIQAVISDRAAGRTRFVIREEGWRDMASLSALQTYQQWLKLSRHYGISNVLILHKMGDFDVVGPEGSQERALAYSLAADIENKFIFRQNAQEYDALVSRLRMPAAHAREALGLEKGTFIAYVGRRSFFVDAFATSTPIERRLVRTDQAVVDPIDSDQDSTCKGCESVIDTSKKFCTQCGMKVAA